MRFIVGLAVGIGIGAAAAMASQGQSGRDLRAEFELIRRDLEKRDYDAVATRLEDRFKELQATLEQRFGEAAQRADEAAEQVDEAAAEAMDEAEEAIADAADAVEDAADQARA